MEVEGAELIPVSQIKTIGTILERSKSAIRDRDDYIEKLNETRDSLMKELERSEVANRVLRMQNENIVGENSVLKIQLQGREILEDSMMQELKKSYENDVQKLGIMASQFKIKDEELKALEIEKMLLEAENSKIRSEKQASDGINSAFDTLAQHYTEFNDKIAGSREELVEVINHLKTKFQQLQDETQKQKSMLELENKYLTQKTQSYQKVLSLVQGIYESKQGKFEQTVQELSEKLIESYKKVMGLSEKSIHLQGEIKSLQQALNEASETPKDTQDDISNRILNAIFGDEPKGDEACYDSSLIEKMSKLSNYVFELRSEISLKETQLLSLKEQIEEKNGKLKSLYILDCPLGFEQAQKIKQTSNSLKKKNMGLLKELEEVKSRSKIIQTQLSTSQRMLVQRTESNKCLLYLNTLLLNRLRETGDQNLSLSQFSPTFFRKERVISLGGEESELLLTIDEVYNHNEELLQKNYELEADLADALMSQRCADGENSLNPNYSENPGSFFNANEQLQPNILGFKKPVTNLVQPFDQHHQSLNPTKLQKQNSFASNFSGRSVQRKKIKSEDLSAGERDNEQQLEWLRSKIQEFSSDVIQAKIQVLRFGTNEEIQSGMYAFFKQHFEESLKFNSDLTDKLPACASDEQFKPHKQEIDMLSVENQFLKEKITCFSAAFSQLNQHFFSGVSSSDFVLQKVREIVNLIKEEFSNLKERVESINTVELLQEQVRALKTQLEIERHVAQKVGFNSNVKIQILNDFNGILQTKCVNLTQIVSDYSIQLKQLQKEREKLEANAVLERLKNYITEKQLFFDSLYDKYSHELDKHKNGSDGSKDKVQELEEQINRIYSGESQVFRELREKFESQFEEVMEKANERVNKIKEESEQNLRVKNAELEQIKSQLQELNFEGKQELENGLSQLQQENLRLNIDIQNLELRNDLKEHGNEVIVQNLKDRLTEKARFESENFKNSTNVEIERLLSERDSLHKAALEKVTVENIQKAEELNKKLEDRNKHQEELNKKIAVLENQIKTLEIADLNAKENLQKVEGEKVSLLARITELEEQVQSALLATEALRTNNEPVDEVKITENDDAGIHSELGAKISALTEELDRLSKLREADLDQILGILQEWKNSENKEEQQTLTDYLQRLDDWFTQDEGGMTQEELAKYS